MASSTRPTDPAVRTAVGLVRAIALLVIGAAVLVVAFGSDDDDAGVPPAIPETPDEQAPSVASVDVDDVLAERAAALAAADGRHDAIVSLVSYRDVASVRRVAERAGVEVVAVLAAAPGRPPELVEGSLEAWVQRRRAAATAERAALAEVLPTVDPADPFAAAYAEDIAALDEELAALDAGGELLFGFTTTASAGALRQLAERADVRLVDVGGVLALGLRPEEVDVTGEPRTRPPRP